MDKKGIREVDLYVSAGDDPAGMSEQLNSPSSLEIEILSDPAMLGQLRRDAEAFAIRVGMDEADVSRVVLAMDEALTNIIRHAYGDDNGRPIEITMMASDEDLEVIIRDYGLVVHPSAIHSRDLDDVRPGGLGVHIMNECMDEVNFSPADQGGGTVLTMTKRIRKK